MGRDSRLYDLHMTVLWHDTFLTLVIILTSVNLKMSQNQDPRIELPLVASHQQSPYYQSPGDMPPPMPKKGKLKKWWCQAIIITSIAITASASSVITYHFFFNNTKGKKVFILLLVQ